MIKKITIPPTSTPVEVTAESIDGKLTLSPNGLVATVGVSTLTLEATPGTPIVTPPPVVDPPPVVVPPSGLIPADKKLVFSPDLTKPLPKKNGVFVDGEFRAGQMTNASIVTKDGAPALRLSVKATDGNVSSGYRDEVQSFVADTGDMWYEWEQMWEALPTGGDWDGHSWQFHPDNDRGSATLGLWSEGGKFDIHHNPSGGQSGAIMKPIGATKTITPGKWYKQLLHVKWSKGSDGIIEYWIDGVKYIDFKGITSAVGVYWKWGLNRWLMKKDATCFYRNIKTYK